MRKLEFLPSTVSVKLSVVALPIVPKVEFIFEIMLLSFFFTKVQEAALNLWSIQVNFFTRKVWWLATPWSSILRQPKHWFVFCLEVPIKEVVYLTCNVPWLRKGRNPKLVIRQFDVIDEEMKKNDELSLVELQRILLACCNITVSTRAISSQWKRYCVLSRTLSCSERAPTPQKFWRSRSVPFCVPFAFQ